MIQSVPYNNPKVLQLFPLLNDNYSSSHLDILLSDTTFFKTSWKSILNHSIDNSKTLYGHLVDVYLN